MLRALSVDDEFSNHLLLKRFVEEEKLVEMVGQFTEALTALEQMSQIQPDVIFVDIEMPVMNGLEFAEQAVSICPDIQIIFVTAYSQYAIEAFRVNALDYLLKPIDPHEMNRVIHKLINNIPLKGLPASLGTADLTDRHMVRTLGDFEVYGTVTKKRVQWLTAKVEELLAYLILHPEKSVMKEELCEVLWPDSEHQKALVNLYTTVYRLKKTIIKERVPLQIISDRYGYQIESAGCFIDYREFNRLTQGLESRNGSVDSDSDIDMLILAASYYQGEIFAPQAYLWSAPYSEALNQMFRLLCYRLSRFYTDRNALDQAAQHLENLLTRFPDEETACILLMDLYKVKNNRPAIEDLYQKYTRYLLEELNVTITPEFENYYRSLL